MNWKAALQSVVALHKNRMYSYGRGIQGSYMVKRHIEELRHCQRSQTVFFDNQSAICLSKIQTHHENTKNIDIKLHLIKLEVSKATIKLKKIYTNDIVTDMLTKFVSSANLDLCFRFR